MPVDTNTDTLNFRKTHASHFLLLARIARKTLALNATSTQPERSFSHAGVILNHRRSMMSNHRAEELVFFFRKSKPYSPYSEASGPRRRNGCCFKWVNLRHCYLLSSYVLLWAAVFFISDFSCYCLMIFARVRGESN